MATKSPWPPVDGGRLLLSLTLEGLERAGCQTTLVAPSGPASTARALTRSWRLPLGPSTLPGDPPVVLLVSRGWLPNEDSVRWFLGEVWPAVHAEVPGAVLHVFGSAGGPGTVHHAPPEDSAEAFAPGSVLAVPLRIGSGVRMKVLEAWARGVPVVGTSAAVSGLEVADGREALVADDPAAFARAVARLRSEVGLAERLVAGGRQALRERHDPARVVADLLSVYEEVLGSRPPARSDGS